MAKERNKHARIINDMCERLTAFVEQGISPKQACKLILLNTPNVSRHRSDFFKIVDETFPEIKAGLNPVFFNNFKHGNKFFFEYLTDTCNHCKICGIPIPSNYEFCSAKCMWTGDEVRNKQKWGVIRRFGEKGLACDEVMSKRKKTCLEKYGCEFASQNPEIIRKTIETNRRNHGGMLAMHTQAVKDKIKQTNLKRYGVENASQSEEIKAKIKQTNLDRTGYVCNFADPEKRAEYDKICREKYGDDFNQIVCANEAFVKKYGCLNPNIAHIKHHDELYKEFVLNNFVNENGDFNMPDFCAYFNVSRVFALQFKRKNHIFLNNSDREHTKGSKPQTALYNDIPTENKILNDRKILKGKELDIVLPDIKLAIEYDGEYWHTKEQLKDRNCDIKFYHLNKLASCNRLGYDLFHVFEGEDLSIWLSMICNRLGMSNVVYARKSVCKIISLELAEQFLNENCLQRKCKTGKIRYGLFYHDELVEVMILGQMQFCDNEWELLRICSKKGTRVSGGASKLFRRFIRDKKPSHVTASADRRYSNGNVYEVLGFKKTGETEPKEVQLQRFAVFDCGNIVYEYGGDTPE